MEVQWYNTLNTAMQSKYVMDQSSIGTRDCYIYIVLSGDQQWKYYIAVTAVTASNGKLGGAWERGYSIVAVTEYTTDTRQFDPLQQTLILTL